MSMIVHVRDMTRMEMTKMLMPQKAKLFMTKVTDGSCNIIINNVALSSTGTYGIIKMQRWQLLRKSRLMKRSSIEKAMDDNERDSNILRATLTMMESERAIDIVKAGETCKRLTIQFATKVTGRENGGWQSQCIKGRNHDKTRSIMGWEMKKTNTHGMMWSIISSLKSC